MFLYKSTKVLRFNHFPKNNRPIFHFVNENGPVNVILKYKKSYSLYLQHPGSAS